MATLRRPPPPACGDRLPALRAALAAVDAAGDAGDLAAAAARVRAVVGACQVPPGTVCYSHKVARMAVYRWCGGADPAAAAVVRRVLGRLP